MFTNDSTLAERSEGKGVRWPFSVTRTTRETVTADGETTHVQTATEVLDASASIGTDVEGVDTDGPRAGDHTGGVHSITRTTDFWFDLEIARIERKAIEEADQWAVAGLPRHDLQMDEPLPVESTLATLCTELYRRWIERVKTRVQDAIEESGQHAARAVAQLRFHLGSLSIAGQESTRAEADLRELRTQSGEREVRFGYPRLFSHGGFILLIGFVTLVDWIANVPIFMELLPQEAGATALWSTLMSSAERYGLWAGIYRLWARIVFSPEVTLLALGVIVFLMFLCHALGGAIRAWWSLRGDERPRALATVSAYRRQRGPIMLASGVGIVLVLAALALSRSQIESATERRYGTAVAARDAVAAQLQAAQQAQDAAAILELTPRLEAAQAEAAELEARAQYARGIADMNLPVFFLNLVLVLAAAVASYLHASAAETNELGPDPRLAELGDKLQALRREEAEHRRALHGVDVEVQGHVARLNYLLRSDPLEGWEGKTERLRRVIPLFRAENARRRGLDPASIVAFQRPFPLELPTVPAGQFFTVPADLKDVLREFQELRPQAALAERGTPLRIAEGGAA